MTLAEPSNTDLAVPDDLTGLEDFDTSDYVMPTLKIAHDKAVFVDGLSNEEYPKIEVVLLGLIKQRILWDADVKEDARPLCKSYDFAGGIPDTDNFPWRASGFDRSQFVEGTPLPCAGCALKEWGTHPKGETPWCAEQHTFALLMPLEGGFAPALLTLQRSGMKASRSYLTSFARTQTPLYTVRTTISLQQQRRGTVSYSVPMFAKGPGTERDEWANFQAQYRQIRDFVQTPRERSDDGTSSPTTTVASSATAAAAPTTPLRDNDELPF